MICLNIKMASLTYSTGDPIDILPTDQNVPSSSEIQILNTLFKEKQTFLQKFFANSKDVLIVGVLFVLLSFKFVDEQLQKYIPTTSSIYIMTCVKALLIMALFFIAKNWYLVRK